MNIYRSFDDGLELLQLVFVFGKITLGHLIVEIKGYYKAVTPHVNVPTSVLSRWETLSYLVRAIYFSARSVYSYYTGRRFFSLVYSAATL